MGDGSVKNYDRNTNVFVVHTQIPLWSTGRTVRPIARIRVDLWNDTLGGGDQLELRDGLFFVICNFSNFCGVFLNVLGRDSGWGNSRATYFFSERARPRPRPLREEEKMEKERKKKKERKQNYTFWELYVFLSFFSMKSGYPTSRLTLSSFEITAGTPVFGKSK